jgi:hypothetical protein
MGATSGGVGVAHEAATTNMSVIVAMMEMGGVLKLKRK